MPKPNKAALAKELRHAIDIIDGDEDPHFKLGYVGSLIAGLIAELEGKDSWATKVARGELRKPQLGGRGGAAWIAMRSRP